MALSPQARDVVIPVVILTALSLASVALRFIARLRGKMSLGLDDWIIFAALLTSLTLFASSMYAAATGLTGVPLQELSRNEYVRGKLLRWIEMAMTHVNIGLVKISILWFYRRIFRGKSFMRVVNTFLALVCVWTIATFFLVIFSSEGVSGFWTADINDPSVKANYDISGLIMATAIVDVTFDAAILSIPILPVLKLQMSTKRKVAVIGIFLLGAFCLVASIARLYYTTKLWRILDVPVPQRGSIADNNTLWGRIEANACIIAACLPVLGPLVRDVHPLETLVAGFRSVISLRNASFLSPKRSSDSLSKVDVRTGSSDSAPRTELNTLGSYSYIQVETPRLVIGYGGDCE